MIDRSSVSFGRDRKGDWLLDPEVTYLNHGTVGATPREVLAEQRRIQDEIERRPAQFLLRELSATRVGSPTGATPRLRLAATEVGRHLGVQGEDLVFVDNATAGANAILRSLDLGPDDDVAVVDLEYGAIIRAAAYAARVRGGRLVRIGTEPPYTPENVLRNIAEQLTERTRMLVVDHISAESALILPVAAITALCRSRGILTLVDGAHAPGAIPVDIPSTGADMYIANLHKWAWVPRSCGILWARPDVQSWIHPPVISWGLDKGFTTEFDWVGTRDPSAALAAPAAFRLMASFGMARIQAYNHDLAWRAALRLADRWAIDFGIPESMVGAMVTVPLPANSGATFDDAARLRDALLFEDQIEIQLHAWRGRLWARLSAQIYNDLDDVDRLAVAVTSRL